MEEYLVGGALPRTGELRDDVVNNLLDPNDGYSVGLGLGIMARGFGVRANVTQIARRFLYDSLRKFSREIQIDDEDYQVMRIKYWGDEVVLGYEYFCDVEDGINEAVIDWWLTDSNFCDAYEEYRDWVSQIRDEMIGQRERLLDIQVQVDTDIEQAAVELGL